MKIPVEVLLGVFATLGSVIAFLYRQNIKLNEKLVEMAKGGVTNGNLEKFLKLLEATKGILEEENGTQKRKKTNGRR